MFISQPIRNLFFKTMFFIGKLFLILSVVSCASTTSIRVLNPKGVPDQDVKIYVDDIYKGSGQVEYSDMKPKTALLNSTVVQLRKEGCKTQRQELKVKINLLKFIGSMGIAAAGGGLSGYWAINRPFESGLASFALIGAVFIAAIIPSLWVSEYKPLHSYDFYCEKEGG